VKNLFTFFVDLFIVIFALFFMFRDGEKIVRGASHLLLLTNRFNGNAEGVAGFDFRERGGGAGDCGFAGSLGGLAFTIGGISTPVFWQC